jgi:20S proteasome alpha/beta subunit
MQNCPVEPLMSQDYDIPSELQGMTLAIAFKFQGCVIVAADGMAYMSGGEGDVPYPAKKIRRVGSDWVLCFAGWGGVEQCTKRLEAELSAGQIGPFNPDLHIGGIDYLHALAHIARENGIKQSFLMLIGNEPEPDVLLYAIDKGPYGPADFCCAIGAQQATALWLIRTLLPCCASMEDAKKLAYFVIWQVAKAELKVGNPEHGYVTSLCILRKGTAPECEDLEYTAMTTCMTQWETALKAAFRQSISQTSAPTQ